MVNAEGGHSADVLRYHWGHLTFLSLVNDRDMTPIMEDMRVKYPHNVVYMNVHV